LIRISLAAALVSLFGGQEVDGFFDVLGGGDQEQFVALVDFLFAPGDGELLGFLVEDGDKNTLRGEVAAFNNILNVLAG